MKNKGDILSIKGDSASYKCAENVIKNIINGIEDAVFPPACPICSKPRVIRGGKRLDIMTEITALTARKQGIYTTRQ